jgi:ADP-dependent NAD(P)H-hydrate dehydratase / NAD(P)H-hydrate epimerase
VHEDGLAALRRAGGRVVDELPRRADLVVDGILGIGGHGGLRAEAATVVRDLPEAWVVAVDVPSGVDASTGEVDGVAVRADVTVTFGALKPGLLVDPGADHAGVVELVDIGLDLPTASVEVLQAEDVATLLPKPVRESDKYRRGVVGVAAGSDHYTGAAVLCTGGAVRGGAGMVRYVGADEPASLVRAAWPEVVVGGGRVQAWTVGSGGGGDAADRLADAVGDGMPVVVDADAITAVAELDRTAGAPLLLTPHAGELARLVGADRDDVEARRLHHARAAAKDLDAVVLLKGSTTVVARPDGAVRVNPTGTPALATAGSGDVLAGLCGALLAGGLDPFDAGSVGAWLHGLAGRLAAEGGRPVSAMDVLAALPDAVGRLTT